MMSTVDEKSAMEAMKHPSTRTSSRAVALWKEDILGKGFSKSSVKLEMRGISMEAERVAENFKWQWQRR